MQIGRGMSLAPAACTSSHKARINCLTVRAALVFSPTGELQGDRARSSKRTTGNDSKLE
jgi:hypothetical protein